MGEGPPNRKCGQVTEQSSSQTIAEHHGFSPSFAFWSPASSFHWKNPSKNEPRRHLSLNPVSWGRAGREGQKEHLQDKPGNPTLRSKKHFRTQGVGPGFHTLVLGPARHSATPKVFFMGKEKGEDFCLGSTFPSFIYLILQQPREKGRAGVTVPILQTEKGKCKGQNVLTQVLAPAIDEAPRPRAHVTIHSHPVRNRCPCSHAAPGESSHSGEQTGRSNIFCTQACLCPVMVKALLLTSLGNTLQRVPLS